MKLKGFVTKLCSDISKNKLYLNNKKKIKNFYKKKILEVKYIGVLSDL